MLKEIIQLEEGDIIFDGKPYLVHMKAEIPGHPEEAYLTELYSPETSNDSIIPRSFKKVEGQNTSYEILPENVNAKPIKKIPAKPFPKDLPCCENSDKYVGWKYCVGTKKDSNVRILR